jgi:pimeloyl-ACP methyl ester carboxylesterase
MIAALGLGPVNLAGHSMGALMTIGTAIDYPDLVLRAAALSAVYQRSPDARAAVRARAAEITADLGGIDGPLDRWFTPAQRALRDQVAGWLRAVSHRGYATAYSAFADGDTVYAGRMHQIRCPLLVLTGEGDANSTPEMSETMARLVPNARAVVIAGHRHMVTLTAPEMVNEALLIWLTTQETAA